MKKLLMILMMASTLIALGQEADFKLVDEPEKTMFLKQMQQQKRSFNCSFTEEKWIAVLDENIVSKGTIQYEAGNQLVCEYTEPESLVLCKKKDGNLTVAKKGKSVPASPMHKQMMQALGHSVHPGPGL